MERKITKTLVAELRAGPPPTGERYFYDPREPLAIRQRANGVLSFCYRGRLNGKPLRVSSGLSVSDENIKDAIAWGREQAALVERGIDPRHVKRQGRIEAVDAAGHTFDSVSQKFVEQYSKRRHRLGTTQEYQATFRTVKKLDPALGSRPIAAVTKKDIRDWLNKIEDNSSVYRRNRTLAYLRRFFRWAIENDYLATSPIDQTIRNEPGEVPRERPLVPDEVRAIWSAAKTLGYPYGHVVRLLLLLGLRLREVAELKWSEVDLERGLIHLPGERTKAKSTHVVPLPEGALKLVRSCPKRADSTIEDAVAVYVFTTDGRSPISGFSKWKRDLDQLSGVQDFRHHDARRWVSSALTDLGFSDRAVKSILGHSRKTQVGVTAVYSQSELVFEQRVALTAWQRLLDIMVHSPGNWSVIAPLLHPDTPADQHKALRFRAAIAAADATWIDAWQSLLAPEWDESVS